MEIIPKFKHLTVQSIVYLVVFALTFAACKKSTNPDNNPEPEYSEVIGSGKSNNVTVSNTPYGNVLAYTSWAKVLQTIDGNTEEKTYPVNISNVYYNKTGEIFVSGYDLDYENPEIVFSYSQVSSKKTGYINVIDSLLTIRIVFSMGFQVEHHFAYQVPVFDDGKSKFTMSYYRYDESSFEFSRPTLVNKDTYSSGGALFNRKDVEFTMSISMHNAKAVSKVSVMALRYLGEAGDRYVLRSEYVSGNDVLNHQGNGTYLSGMKVRKTWSDGAVEDINPNAEINFYAEDVDPWEWIDARPNSVGSVIFNNVTINTLSTSYHESGNENIVIHQKTEEIVINYNYFSMKFLITREEAHYDDGILQKEMPNHKITPQNVMVGNIDFNLLGEEEERKHYSVTLTIDVQHGEYSKSLTYTGRATFL